MGLDMYLSKKIYVGAIYDFEEVSGTIDIRNKSGKIDVNLSRVDEIVERVAYWRKANMIHGWFVDNFADGIDDCRPVSVTSNDLIKLRTLCQTILSIPDGKKRDKKAIELLPVREGFLFGPREIGPWYYECLEETVEALTGIMPDEPFFYEYCASW